MTPVADDETRGGHRVVARPGHSPATIAGPNGRESLWSRMRIARADHACENCGRPVGRGYRPSLRRLDRLRLRLCAACVEGDT